MLVILTFSFSEATSSVWKNTTWTRAKLYTFTNLTSSSDYVVTVYARLRNHTEVASPTEFLTVSTDWAGKCFYNVFVSVLLSFLNACVYLR